jgi:hypothetical protein
MVRGPIIEVCTFQKKKKMLVIPGGGQEKNNLKKEGRGRGEGTRGR